MSIGGPCAICLRFWRLHCGPVAHRSCHVPASEEGKVVDGVFAQIEPFRFADHKATTVVVGLKDAEVEAPKGNDDALHTDR